MTVVLVPNSSLEEALEGALSVSRWCVDHGIDCCLVEGDTSDSARFGALSDIAVRTVEEIGTPRLIVALGGDGTILRAVHLFSGARCPVLGIKFGKLGFLSGAHAESLLHAVEAALDGSAIRERRTLLRIDAYNETRLLGSYSALNEVVIGRGQQARVVSTALEINGHHLYTLRGDGLIVATATGSTAYALSAGGPLVSPGFGGMVVVPLASHTLIQRAIITAPLDAVRVVLPQEKRSQAGLTIDGIEVVMRSTLTHVDIVIAPDPIELVKLENRLFYDTVASEFFRGE